jgi:hypothetical protein
MAGSAADTYRRRAGNVLKIEGKHTYRYVFEARVRNFAQLLPSYMHVRFSDTMLVSASKTPKDDMCSSGRTITTSI